MENEFNIESLLKTYNDMCNRFYESYNELVDKINNSNGHDNDDLIHSSCYFSMEKYIKSVISIQRTIEQINQEIPGYDKNKGYEIIQKFNVIEENKEKLSTLKLERVELNSKGRYNNNGRVDYSEIPKGEAKEAANAWGEGYEPLIKALEHLITNGFKTLACCSGHYYGKTSDRPYISFNMEGPETLALIEKMAKENSCAEVIFNKHPVTRVSSIGIRGELSQRKDFFDKISQYTTEVIKAKTDGNLLVENSLFSQIAQLQRQDGYENIFADIKFEPEEQIYIFIENGNLMTLNSKQMEDYLPNMFAKVQGQRDDKSGRTSKVITKVKDICKKAKVGIRDIKNVPNVLKQWFLAKASDRENSDDTQLE